MVSLETTFGVSVKAPPVAPRSVRSLAVTRTQCTTLCCGATVETTAGIVENLPETTPDAGLVGTSALVQDAADSRHTDTCNAASYPAGMEALSCEETVMGIARAVSVPF